MIRLLRRLIGMILPTKVSRIPMEDPYEPVVDVTYLPGYVAPRPRCSSRKVEGPRSWRCARPAGHMQWTALQTYRHTDGHVDTSGRRHW